MSLKRTIYDVGVVLGALKVPYNITSIIKNITTQFIVEEFGVVINVMNAADYSLINERVNELFKDYRILFVSDKEAISEKRYEILWAMMKSGYMKWLRLNYSAQFVNILETDNLGNRIIDERLAIWDNKPKYRYYIQDNEDAKEVGFRRVLSRDPSFFDYMPSTTQT